MTLELRNKTPYSCQTLPLIDRKGATLLRIVLKGGFDIGFDGELWVAADQPAIVMEDIYWGEPAASSVRFESDVILEKPRAELIFVGNAHAPGGRPVEAMDVQIAYGSRIIKRLRVHGDRKWRRGVTSSRLTRPDPFIAMPIVYERAFGGTDELGSEPRNRVGVGYYSSGINPVEAGVCPPNVEFPDQLVTSLEDRPEPAGLGYIAKNWEPRLAYAGTYDAAWLEDGFPLLPDDFDPHFFQGAPADQWIERPYGGELVGVQGMTADGVLRFHLPPCEIPLRLRYKEGCQFKRMEPETILVEPDERRLVITWGASADIHGDPFRLLEMLIGDEQDASGCRCRRR